MAIENEKEELGYIKAHCINLYADEPDPVIIEFIQTRVALDGETQIVKCNDPKTLEYLDLFLSRGVAEPWEDSYTALRRILEDEDFVIDKFRPYVHPTEDEEGNPIIY